jgi:TATA-box binding protein (TBP) (component of TFIID and TFIIIB)
MVIKYETKSFDIPKEMLSIIAHERRNADENKPPSKSASTAAADSSTPSSSDNAIRSNNNELDNARCINFPPHPKKKGDLEDHQRCVSVMNAKIFSNGNVQVTGVKQIDHGAFCLKAVLDIVKRSQFFPVYADEEADKKLSNTIDKCKGPRFYRACLLNSDTWLGFTVRREVLFDILSNHYNVTCFYEPCIYPGVKIPYSWNAATPGNRGKCVCRTKCSGEGRGDREGGCRRITIVVFRSGCIIVTGAHTYGQLAEAYSFICSIIEKNIQDIEQQFLPF